MFYNKAAAEFVTALAKVTYCDKAIDQSVAMFDKFPHKPRETPMPKDTQAPTTDELAKSFAVQVAFEIDNFVKMHHPGNPGGWPGSAEKEARVQMRAATAQALVSDGDAYLAKLIADYREADAVLSSFTADGDDKHDALGALSRAFEQMARHLAAEHNVEGW